MIKTIQGSIQRASHYGAQGNEEFCLKVDVGLDAKECNRLKKKRVNITHQYIVSLKNIVFDALNLRSLPHVGTIGRARNGIKTVQVTFYMSRDEASRIGADVSKWCLYHNVDLESHIENNKNALFAKVAIQKCLNERNTKLN